ncbi:YwmB family TATA-box binding protein [Halobacillus kuroshimensis]|uniref:YwmB family TATA-box binding protein n=1 Tax=Halobacillus kuroshimensis TaxID=302481 RepID=A0ABS3DUL6_9BACI|nr:YwmB family TATA-box binding protein [Halobacillus kuroshimensis]MBN8235011.1 YwmB family TATA-box binding protein [Halobacillus kuroshimensis]
MWKNILAGVLAAAIVGTGAYPQEMTQEQEPLMMFASFAEDKQLNVEEWTMMMKRKVPAEQSGEIMERILEQGQHQEVSHEETAQAEKWIVTNRHKNKKIVETYSMISPRNMKNKAELVYSIQGEGTSSLTQDLFLSVEDVKSRYFSKSATIFSCLKAVSNGIIDDVLVYKKFKDTLDVATIDEIDENGWTSRSGWTDKWAQSIPSGKQSMNVQFATRTLGGETNITIGTPIITAEY